MKRFVPESCSLMDDAPGWKLPTPQKESIDGKGKHHELGPICWKCRGTKTQVEKKKKSKCCIQSCPVCKGKGNLPPKRADLASHSEPGKITRGRRRPAGFVPRGPPPYALSQPELEYWTELINKATETCTDVEISEKILHTITAPPPPWLPTNPGEEFCNLVGQWRILQRKGSHRWTTDDLCTAYWADRTMSTWRQTPQSPLQYLDLGTGNASVLQMTYWALSTRYGSGSDRSQHTIEAIGVEARGEALRLARRSVSYNIGSDFAKIVHGDFRQLSALLDDDDNKFGLITGTPPYFRVDFDVNDDTKEVTTAVIVEGGMPTAKQSAPARCEFRGGIEAYCRAAAAFLRPDGCFVVCENFLNHQRTLDAAASAGLRVLSRLDVIGRIGKPVLFCVYSMVLIRENEPSDSIENCSTSALDCNSECSVTTVTVRNGEGMWTTEYKSILNSMGIPYIAGSA